MFLNGLKACNFNKVFSCEICEIPTQVFSCEICEIFKNTYFEEHLRATASEMIIYHSFFRVKLQGAYYFWFSFLFSQKRLTQCFNHGETSQLIWRINQFVGNKAKGWWISKRWLQENKAGQILMHIHEMHLCTRG